MRIPASLYLKPLRFACLRRYLTVAVLPIRLIDCCRQNSDIEPSRKCQSPRRMDAIDCPPLLAFSVTPPIETFLARLSHIDGQGASQVVMHSHLFRQKLL